jgi:hypothetical protein
MPAIEKNKEWLALCCRAIEASLDWGASSSWRNGDFENLSEKIFEKTGVRLSLSTIKRIWGRVRYDNFPGSATLNALAQFIGYASWLQFCEQHPLNGSSPSIALNIDDPGLSPIPVFQPRAKKMHWLVLPTLVIIAAIGLLAARHYTKTTNSKRAYNYQFSSRKTSDDLPNSVVFSYDAGADKDQKVMIQQSWDSSRRELVDPLGHRHTSIYYYPGYFRAKLMVDDSIVKQAPVFIQTRGWKAIAERTPLPVYFPDTMLRKNGGIAISADQFSKAIGTADFNNHWLQFSNMRNFPGIDGNNFEFKTILRNNAAVEQSLCRKIRVVILGTERPVIIPLVSKGCIADLDIYTGDTVVSGKNNDLSALGCDFTIAQGLSLSIADKMLRLSLNGKPALSFPVKQSLGEIVGVRIFFEGGGEISAASLSTPGTINYDLMKLR